MLKDVLIGGLLVLGAFVVIGCSSGQSGTPDNSMQASTPSDVPTSNVDPCAVATPPAVASLMGRYKISSFERYRGGLMPHAAALERVGKEMLMTDAEFQFDGEQLASPKYEIACYNDIRVEGEVPTYEARSLSSFYGFASDRDVVWVLTVHDSADQKRASFEVLPGNDGPELWELGDGWLFMLRPAVGAKSR